MTDLVDKWCSLEETAEYLGVTKDTWTTGCRRQQLHQAGGPCAIYQGADGTLLPAPAGKGQKARPAG